MYPSAFKSVFSFNSHQAVELLESITEVVIIDKWTLTAKYNYHNVISCTHSEGMENLK